MRIQNFSVHLLVGIFLGDSWWGSDTDWCRRWSLLFWVITIIWTVHRIWSERRLWLLVKLGLRMWKWPICWWVVSLWASFCQIFHFNKNSEKFWKSNLYLEMSDTDREWGLLCITFCDCYFFVFRDLRFLGCKQDLHIITRIRSAADLRKVLQS